MRQSLFVILFGLAACTPQVATVRPPSTDLSADERVFVATMRTISDTGVITSSRSPECSFMSLGVSVPVDREAGSIRVASGSPDQDRDFFLSDALIYSGKSEFQRNVAAALRQLPRQDREIVVYVHGFNTAFATGVYRLAQLRRDLDLPGVPVHFSWPSAANPLNYAYDRDSLLFSRDGLADLLTGLSEVGAERIIVVAHSLGSMLTMEAMSRMGQGEAARILDGVVLVSPDIDLDVFRSQARAIGTLPETFAIVVSERDRVLQLSARLTGQTNRLGNLSNPAEVADLDVLLLDVTAFSEGSGHFTPGTSPALLALLAEASRLGDTFSRDASGRPGLIPSTVLTVQNATQIILRPGL